MELTANMKEWFSNLIDGEMNMAISAGKNEHIWALGSETQEEAELHERNCEENKQYAEFLKGLREKYVG